MFEKTISALKRVWLLAGQSFVEDSAKRIPFKTFNTPQRPSEHMAKIFSTENFHAFSMGYLDGDLSDVVNQFVGQANRGSLQYPYVFWFSREEEMLLDWKLRPRYLKNFMAKNRIKLSDGLSVERSACFYKLFNENSYQKNERPEGISPFFKGEAMALAVAMQNHSDIVNAMIVTQDMIYKYFISVARKYGAEDIAELAADAKTNNFFAELLPHIIKVAERDFEHDLRDVFKIGINEAARSKVFSSIQGHRLNESQEVCGITIKRCPFSDFVMDIWSGEEGKVGMLPVKIVGRLQELRKSGVDFETLRVP